MAGARALAPVARSVRTTVSARRPLRCGAVMAPAEPPKTPDTLDDVTLSGLNGKPLLVTEWPSKVRQDSLSRDDWELERGLLRGR
jgi:hypothetical protein